MKKIIVIILSGLLLTLGNAYAETNDKHNINQQNLSRQPYKQTSAKDQIKSEGFEGATLINESVETDKKSRQIQFHRFDRRSFMEKSAS